MSSGIELFFVGFLESMCSIKICFGTQKISEKSRALGGIILLVFGFGGSIFCLPGSSSVGFARRTS
jgi:hypothetical protein